MGYVVIQLNSIFLSINEIKNEEFFENIEKIQNSIVFIISEIDSEEAINNAVNGTLYYSLEDQSYKKIGTGFVVDPEGYIATAKHVISGVSDSSKIEVVFIKEFREGNKITYQWDVAPAKSFFYNNVLDLSLLKIDTDKKLDYLELADEDELIIGKEIFIFGFPYADPNYPPNVRLLLNQGILSGKGLSTFGNNEIPVLFISAFVNPGNSGGPVILKSNGKVVGVINQRISDDTGSQVGIGIASEIFLLNEAIEEMKRLDKQ